MALNGLFISRYLDQENISQESQEEVPEEEDQEEVPEENDQEEVPEDNDQEEVTEINYYSSVSSNGSYINPHKESIDVFLLGAIIGCLLGLIFFQRLKTVWI